MSCSVAAHPYTTTTPSDAFGSGPNVFGIMSVAQNPREAFDLYGDLWKALRVTFAWKRHQKRRSEAKFVAAPEDVEVKQQQHAADVLMDSKDEDATTAQVGDNVETQSSVHVPSPAVYDSDDDDRTLLGDDADDAPSEMLKLLTKEDSESSVTYDILFDFLDTDDEDSSNTEKSPLLVDDQ
ncbi:hypothetical protein FISHEDRAFT_58237 [Fistulina hepatica ATCC 64428]|nr:hypothetical protein FISHEDRAFT_58237 [Fistulina hepatica ATCC 64428]